MLAHLRDHAVSPSVGNWAADTGFYCHLFGHPQPHTPADEAQPYHQVVVLGAVEIRHGVAQKTGVDEEGRNARDGVVLHSQC